MDIWKDWLLECQWKEQVQWLTKNLKCRFATIGVVKSNYADFSTVSLPCVRSSVIFEYRATPPTARNGIPRMIPNVPTATVGNIVGSSRNKSTSAQDIPICR